jgi:hypothetical protein
MVVLVGCLLLCSCGIFERAVDRATASELEAAILTALREKTTLQDWGGGSGGGTGPGGGTLMSRKEFIIQDDNFDIKSLPGLAQGAIRQWGKLGTFSDHGEGASGNSYSVDLGGRGTHLFCHVIGRYDPAMKKHIVMILIDLVE